MRSLQTETLNKGKPQTENDWILPRGKRTESTALSSELGRCLQKGSHREGKEMWGLWVYGKLGGSWGAWHRTTKCTLSEKQPPIGKSGPWLAF